MNIRSFEYRSKINCVRCNSKLDRDGRGFDIYIYPKSGLGYYDRDDLLEVIQGECKKCHAKTIRLYIKKEMRNKYKDGHKNVKRDHNPALGWRQNRNKHTNGLGAR